MTWLSSAEVLKDVYDDQRGNAYIRVNRRLEGDGSVVFVDDIAAKKSEWEKRFPEKKVIAMSVVDDRNVRGFPFLAGLLIHYEQR